MVREIAACRVSGSRNLITVLSLGTQKLTGVFPRGQDEAITEGPLELVWCPDSALLQLKHSYDPLEMYGMNYGYRSGLNASMVKHLNGKVRDLLRRRPLAAGEVVIDIGSNDATTLKAFPGSVRRIGVDPTGVKFKQYYTEGIELVPDFFSAATVSSACGDARASLVTSIAMFYDLESPVAFVEQILEILRDDGVWHFEQSYMPSMLRMNSYDTICHEHIEYYSLGAVKKILDQCGLRILDVQMNAVNGGSFAVTACRSEAPWVSDDTVISWLLEQEEQMGLHTPRPFRAFEERVFEHRANLTRLVRRLNAGGKRVFGYGASTKGNVLLQFCGLTRDELPVIAEINPDKFGCVTPGTGIPIVSEAEAKAMRPDYFLVLPWHFKESIIAREADYLAQGGRMILPLPEIEIIGG